MQLLTKQLISKLPKLYDTEYDPPEEKTAVAKFFHPASQWTWYVIEYDGEDTCWGLVQGFETAFGYFSLKELTNVVDRLGLRIERDIFFRPTMVKDLAVFGQGGMVY
jgi:hypothetical protein